MYKRTYIFQMYITVLPHCSELYIYVTSWKLWLWFLSCLFPIHISLVCSSYYMNVQWCWKKKTNYVPFLCVLLIWPDVSLRRLEDNNGETLQLMGSVPEHRPDSTIVNQLRMSEGMFSTIRLDTDRMESCSLMKNSDWCMMEEV